MKLNFLKIIFLFLFSTISFANYSDLNTKRYQQLIKEVRCVVCQGQSIADSNALLAKDLRMKIYQLIEENKNNDEIKDYLAKRYGEYILLEPRLAVRTLALWGFPLLGLVSIMFIFYFLFNKRPVNDRFIN